jgi:manganese efflux pump family protein
LLAGVGVSTDEVAVGFALGALGLPIPAVLAVIAGQAFAVTIVGILLGRRIGTALGRQTARTAGFVAGIAFVLLGGFLLVERLARDTD